MVKLSKAFLLISAAVSVSLSASAQLVVNGAAVTVNSGATVTVLGDVQLQSGTVSNQGNVELTGNWQNNAGAAALSGTGTVTLKGTGAQSIGGTQPTAFTHLNQSLATGTVTLNQDISVAGTLTIGASQLLLNSHLLHINNSSTSAISVTSGETVSETGPGLGTLSRLIGTNTGTFLYPMGTAAGNNIPVTAQVTTAGSPAAGMLQVSTYPTGSNNSPLPAGVTDVNGQELGTLDRFWVIETQGFTTDPVLTLTLSYLDSEWQGQNIGNENELELWRWDGSMWQGPMTGTVDPVANTITVSGVSNFGVFAAASQLTPLPVQLVSFTARKNGADAVLDWKTVWEEHNAGYRMEVSTDGVRFRELGFVSAAAPNSNKEQKYTFTDREPGKQGVRFYRIQQLDLDGHLTNLGIRPVRFEEMLTIMSVFPNPFSEGFSVAVTTPLAGEAELVITDVLGREINRRTEMLQAGYNTVKYSLPADFASGVYQLSLHCTGQHFQARLIKHQ